mmetsp:Transcript_43090/g.99226  ORF Transcript_43090/g.99226 Transcript_43090/m.99226 type:complete len:514 (-) Transcript_43090:145-1686(-)
MTASSGASSLLTVDNALVVSQKPMAGVGDPFQQSEDYDFMEESPARPYQHAVTGVQLDEAVGGGNRGAAISLPMSVAVATTGHRQVHMSPGASQAILRASPAGPAKPPPCDPLGAVMDWLGHADLPDHIGSDDPSIRAEGAVKGAPPSAAPQPGRQVESASARGSQPPRPTSASKGRNTDGVPSGAKPIVFPRDAVGLQDRAEWGQRMMPGPASVRLQQELESEGAVACFCVRGDKPKSSAVTVQSMDEETEWDRRKRQTGVSARLVWYQPGDVPSDELVLRGGKGGRIVVTAVSDTGKAAAAGVRPGDVLASIDGKRDFGGHSAETILTSLVLPVAIIFMGFIGKLQAEVRLNHNDGESLGMKVHEEVPIGPIGRPHAVKVVDKVVFSQPSDLGQMSPGGPNYSPREGTGFSERGSLRDVVAMCDLGPDNRSRSMGFVPQKSATTSGPSSQTAAALAAQREPDPLEDGLGPNLSVAPSRLPERLKPRSESFGSGSWEEAFAGEDNIDTLLTV